MKAVKLTEQFFIGAASIERVDGGLRPWRLSHAKRHLYPSPNDGLMNSAGASSGVRLRFKTASQELGLTFQPLFEPGGNIPDGHWFDVVIDNEIIDKKNCFKDDSIVQFENIPAGEKIVEIWLPTGCGVVLEELQIEDDASVQLAPDRRPMWVTWGSSLTHCVRAESASTTWPATVSRKHDLNLVNLGLGGQCHLDPMVAMYIRDLPADYISLKLGINTISGSVNARTYPALVTAAVKIIREKHSHTPIVLISPFGFPPNEMEPNVVGYTIQGMREDMEAVYERLVLEGDQNLYYVSGADLFSAEETEAHSEDRCHAKAEGIGIQAERFSKLVMPLLLGK